MATLWFQTTSWLSMKIHPFPSMISHYNLHWAYVCWDKRWKHRRPYALITSHYVHYIPLHIITQSFASISHSKMEECWVESLSDHFLTDSTECQTSLRFERTGVATRLASAVCDTFPLLQQPHGNIDEWRTIIMMQLEHTSIQSYPRTDEKP